VRSPDATKATNKPNKKTARKEAARAAAWKKLDVPPTAVPHIAFDLSFCGTMRPGELNSMVRQIRTCQDYNLVEGACAHVGVVGSGCGM
jgi:hypothetical protein